MISQPEVDGTDTVPPSSCDHLTYTHIPVFACEFTAKVVRADAVPPSGFGSLQIKSAALGLATSESFVPFPIDAKSGGIASQVEIRFTVDRTPAQSKDSK